MSTRQKWFKKSDDKLVPFFIIIVAIGVVFGGTILADNRQYAHGVSINSAL